MMFLLTQYFEPPVKVRQDEIDSCLRMNIDNPLITKIYLFVERDYNLSRFDHIKLSIQNIQRRLTYDLAFLYANTHLRDQICILANSDICFDETLAKLKTVNFANKFLAVTRRYPAKHPDGSYNWVVADCTASQDVWIFRSPIKNFYCQFPLGVPGCDNRLAFEAINSGMYVMNPARLLVCKHIHFSNIKNYWSNNGGLTAQVQGPYRDIPFSDSF